jgi:hypothetical protein
MVKNKTTNISRFELSDRQISLNGLNSVIGRGVVIHADTDDLGRVRLHEAALLTFSFLAFPACDINIYFNQAHMSDNVNETICICKY